MPKPQIKHSRAFAISILAGFTIWFITNLFLPVITNSINFNTIAYIAISVIAFVFGFYVFGNKQKLKHISTKKASKYFIVIVLLSLLGWVFRYFDLFVYRSLSFSNSYYQNKLINIKLLASAPLWLKSISTLRVLYEIPIIILIITKSKNIKFWIIGLLIFSFGSVEIFLLGTRKPVFHLFILVIITVLICYKLKRLINYKTVLVLGIILPMLGLFSYYVINKRVQSHNEENIIAVTTSRYNDFVKIDSNKVASFHKNPNTLGTKAELMLIHTGQYLTHGFYELDYLINQDLHRAKGVYTLNPIYKLTNQIGLTKTDLKINNFHPRVYVYVSFFGALFIDYGWFALIAMFLFGAFQKQIYLQSKNHLFFKVFWIYLLAINLIMPFFNLLSGSQLYLFGYMSIFALIILILQRKKRLNSSF